MYSHRTFATEPAAERRRAVRRGDPTRAPSRPGACALGCRVRTGITPCTPREAFVAMLNSIGILSWSVEGSNLVLSFFRRALNHQTSSRSIQLQETVGGDQSCEDVFRVRPSHSPGVLLVDAGVGTRVRIRTRSSTVIGCNPRGHSPPVTRRGIEPRLLGRKPSVLTARRASLSCFVRPTCRRSAPAALRHVTFRAHPGEYPGGALGRDRTDSSALRGRHSTV